MFQSTLSWCLILIQVVIQISTSANVPPVSHGTLDKENRNGEGLRHLLAPLCAASRRPDCLSLVEMVTHRCANVTNDPNCPVNCQLALMVFRETVGLVLNFERATKFLTNECLSGIMNDDTQLDVHQIRKRDVFSWLNTAAKDTVDWVDNAIYDVEQWGNNAAKHTGNWVEGAVSDTGEFLGDIFDCDFCMDFGNAVQYVLRYAGSNNAISTGLAAAACGFLVHPIPVLTCVGVVAVKHELVSELVSYLTHNYDASTACRAIRICH